MLRLPVLYEILRRGLLGKMIVRLGWVGASYNRIFPNSHVHRLTLAIPPSYHLSIVLSARQPVFTDDLLHIRAAGLISQWHTTTEVWSIASLQ